VWETPDLLKVQFEIALIKPRDVATERLGGRFGLLINKSA
jgi:hypothetical protein